ncbi:unnamed protein product [Brugia timori]|uniref:C2H2-type domain-containing protein n=1 Tax=Brugia timori TaxID=42155 RepID=A0A0R3R9H3_9BILA|nr:unnamed protein product [Brugia timori]
MINLQRKCQISETNPSTHIAITDTTTNLINSDNSALLQELFCEACSTLYNDILNAIDHQSLRHYLNVSNELRERVQNKRHPTDMKLISSLIIKK